MNYNGTIYRPPVEAYTLLLPITEGCSHNSCKFCNMYQNIPFRMLSLAEVEDFLKKIFEFNGENCQQVEKIYLVGADPFALPAKKLLERAEKRKITCLHTYRGFSLRPDGWNRLKCTVPTAGGRAESSPP